MKKESIVAFIIGLVVSCVSACNDEVFVRPLEVTPVSAEIGPDKPSLSIGIEGENWTIAEVRFYSKEENLEAQKLDGKWIIDNTLSYITVERSSGGADVRLERFASCEAGTLDIRIEDDYSSEQISIKVEPTSELVIRVTDVRYNLSQWSGYPDKDFDNTDEVCRFPQGLMQPTVYTFDDIRSLPVLYYFRMFKEPTAFERLVLSSKAEVDVPTYNLSGIGWSMKGERVHLVDYRSFYETLNVPQTPPAVELPAGKPLSIGITTYYECLGVDCVMDAVNPATGATETINCQLVIWQPVRMASKVTML